MKNINNEEFEIGDCVSTPYGSGVVRNIIKDSECEVEHDQIYSGNYKARAPMNPDDIFYTYDIDQLSHCKNTD